MTHITEVLEAVQKAYLVLPPEKEVYVRDSVGMVQAIGVEIDEEGDLIIQVDGTVKIGGE
ncbi:hypothetical protein BSP14_237 [Bacillus phage BSP14]|nr:hypothetical protein BSP14_237 [Bacillus phage BSP14]